MELKGSLQVSTDVPSQCLKPYKEPVTYCLTNIKRSGLYATVTVKKPSWTTETNTAESASGGLKTILMVLFELFLMFSYFQKKYFQQKIQVLSISIIQSFVFLHCVGMLGKNPNAYNNE